MKTLVLFLVCCSAISFAQTKAVAKPKALTPQAPAAQLAWTETGCSTCTFNVYRGITQGGEGTTPLASGITTLSYTDSTVVRGSFYCYEVTAVNTVGESPKSNEICGTDPTVPTAPSGLTVTFQ